MASSDRARNREDATVPVDAAAVEPTVELTGAYDRVLRAREKGRPTAVEFIEHIVDDFIELHGDRRSGDDTAIIGGIGRLAGTPVTVIGIEKGRTPKERHERQFGSPHPEGYRKAQRLMKQAEKFGRPIICLVDTPGAHPGIGAEERGQGQAIAESLTLMMDLGVPVVSVVIGEGGSGGALALAVADEVWMLENAVYSVISPEGCASILWRDSKRAAEAAEHLKLTAPDLLENGVVDAIVPEHGPDFTPVYEDLTERLSAAFERLAAQSDDERRAARYQRFRKLGA